MFARTYSIDPGLTGTGWALWGGPRTVLEVGVLHANNRKNRPLAMRCEDVARQLRRIVRTTGGLDEQVRVYIEMPQMMTNAAGLAAQAGSVYKLTFLAGYLAARLFPCRVYDVLPVTWKGQLPKELVMERIKRDLGEEECERLGIKSHAWDAVGIGLWANGVWG